MFGKKKSAPKKAAKTKKETKPAEAKAPAPKKAEAKAKAPKGYRREARAELLSILRSEEVVLNGRKCLKVRLSDGTSDTIPEADLENKLVW